MQNKLAKDKSFPFTFVPVPPEIIVPVGLAVGGGAWLIQRRMRQRRIKEFTAELEKSLTPAARQARRDPRLKEQRRQQVETIFSRTAT